MHIEYTGYFEHTMQNEQAICYQTLIKQAISIDLCYVCLFFTKQVYFIPVVATVS